MRLLVTGASGHVGGAVARRLAHAGHDVAGLSRRCVADLPASVNQVQGDLATESLETLAARIDRCDAIVHAAACLDFADDAALLAANVHGTHTVTQLARQWECSHFLYVSSVAVHGQPGTRPLHEETPADPQSLYAVTKLFGEHLTSLLRGSMAALSFRIPSPIGPGLGSRRIVGAFVAQAMNGHALTVHGRGGRRQNYLDVRDIAHAVEAAMRTQRSGAVLLGAPASVSNLELAQRIVAALDSPSAISLSGEDDPDEHLSWELDCTRAREWLGWTPRYTLETSVRDMAKAIAGKR